MAQLISRGQKVVRGLALPGKGLDSIRQRVRRQNRRIAALEKEVQEQRRLNRRFAELVDVVEELLVPAVDRDEERLRTLLRRDRETNRTGPPRTTGQ